MLWHILRERNVTELPAPIHFVPHIPPRYFEWCGVSVLGSECSHWRGDVPVDILDPVRRRAGVSETRVHSKVGLDAD